MLANLFVLALAVLDTAAASSQQCKPKQLGKYAPLSSNKATQKYCTAYLHGKAPRSVELEERASKTTIEWYVRFRTGKISSSSLTSFQ